MTKVKTRTPPPGPRDIARALETLRDDLRRHDASPVSLDWTVDEGRQGAIGMPSKLLKGPPSEIEKVKAYCARFGEVLTNAPDLWRVIAVEPLPESDWDSRRAAAFHALLERSPWRTVAEARTVLQVTDATTLPDCPPDVITRLRQVPDVRLALAELIDLMLDARPKRRNKAEVTAERGRWVAHALIQIANDPKVTNKEVAAALGITESDYSKYVAKVPSIQRARAANVARAIPAGAGQRIVAQEFAQSVTRRKARQG